MSSSKYEYLIIFFQKRRNSYLEEDTSRKAEVITCIFSLKEEVGALAKALRLFEVKNELHIYPNVYLTQST